MLQVRDVPDDLHEVLRTRARAAGQSLSEYVLRELREVVRRPDVDELLARAAARGAHLGFDDAVRAVDDEREARTG